MTSFAHGWQSRLSYSLRILFCCITLLVAFELPSHADEPRSLTVSPGSGPAGTKVIVRGTGWDPEYYSNGVRISFDQNFGNGVLKPIADEIAVPPDGDGRFSFGYTIPKGFQQGDVISISGLIGNGGGERANFTVTGGRPEGSGSAVTKSDLQPTRIKYDRDAVRLNNRIHFDAGVKNNGQEDTRSFNVRWLVNGKDVGAYGSHAAVAADTTVLDGNSQFDWTPKKAGKYSVTFIVDADNHVAESNEANNSRSVTLTVRGLPTRIENAVAECLKAWGGKLHIRGSGALIEALRQNNEEAMRSALIAAQDEVSRNAWNNFVQIPRCAILVADLGINPDQAGGGPAPAAPSDLTVQPDPNNHSVMLLSWSDNSTDETGFPVSTGDDYRRAPSHPGTGTVSYKWTGLQPNSRTCFRVRADNGDTFSDWEPSGSPRCATTSAAGPR